jgi:autotransporter-associated beta strand protein
MGISKKLKMIKNNNLVLKMKKTLLFFTAIINFIGFSFFVNAADVTINGSNSTGYTFDDNDTLTLKGPANASGKLNFNSGSISISSTDDGDQITGEVNTVSGTDIRISASSGNTLTISARIGGAGSINKDGEGILILNQSNNYTGTTTISDGTLRLNASGTLSDSTSVNVSSKGTFDVNLTNTIASIEGSGIIDIASSTTLTAGDANDKEFSGVIQGAGNFSKSGSGTLTLSGTNTYSGSTTVSGGTLQLTGSLNNLSAVTVNSGASLDLQASQTIASLDLDGSITRSAGTSTLTVSGTSDLGGNVTTSGTQTYTGATTLSDAITLTTTNSNITFSDTVNSDGTTRNLTINAGTGTTQFAGIVGGTNGVGDIDITGALDLNAAISNASSLTVSGTSNIGANVTTTGTQS